MSKKDEQSSGQKQIEKPEQAVERLTGEILEECKLIATGLQENCFNLVEKTKALMSAESKVK
jgi:hypothetical protein